MRINPRVLMFATVIVLVIAGLVLLGYGFKSQKSYGKVGDYSVKKTEVDAMLKQNPRLSKDAVVTTLLDLHLYRQMADKLGIHVTDSEVSTELQKRLGKSPLWDKLHLTAKAETDLLRNKVESRVLGNTRGRVVILHFEQHFNVFGPGDLRPGETEAKRPQYIAADRAAADDLKNTIYQKLQSKSINFDQAMKMEQDDDRLGTKKIPTTVHSQSFNSADKLTPLSGYFDLPEFKKLFSETVVNSYSAPTLIKLAASEKDKTLVDSWWVIVQVDGRDGSLADSLDSYVKAQKKTLKYEKTL